MASDETPPTAPLPLWGEGGADWRPVSPALAGARRLVTTLSLAPFVLVLLVVAVLWWRWAAVPVAVLLLLWLWAMWFVGRQVSAISWAELPDELAIRRGRLWRQLVTVPYGRIQYVDVSSGPMLRRRGLAGIEVHTASPESSGSIPGLPESEAQALRERLGALGESRRAGL